MKHFLLLTFLLPIVCLGQGDQKIISVPIDNQGGTEQAIVHLPDDYGQTTTLYPLLVFLHGVGEGGTNPASIYNSSSAGGPAYYIAQGQWPSSFVNPADGKSYKFIVVSPQNSQGWSTSAPQLDYVLTSLFKTYRADPARLYLTGISAGGEGVVEYTGGATEDGTAVNGTHKVAAVIPMSAVINGQLEGQYASFLVKNNTRIWGFGSESDIHGENTLDLVTAANQDKANFGLSTSYSGGHCCWMQFYTPSFTQGGMNIYQWALQYTQGTPAPPSSPSTSPTTYAIPGKVEAESYADMSGVATQPTTDVGGGLNVDYINKAGDYMDYSVNVAKAGQYTASFRVATMHSDASFELLDASGKVLTTITAPNTGGYQNWQTVSTTVTLAAGVQTLRVESTSASLWNINWLEFENPVKLPSTVAQPVPGLIQAESYSDMSGVATQATTDVGGGLNVGWIDKGDYMDYYVNVATAGVYTVGFRLATIYGDASLNLLDGYGNLLASVTAPNTGGLETWKTANVSVTLQKGPQLLRIQSTSWDIWNINWIQFTASTGSQAIASAAVSQTSAQLDGGVPTALSTGMTIYPNPVKDIFTIQMNDSLSGKMIVQLVDVSGAIRKVTEFTKAAGSSQVTVNTAGLVTGVYFVRIIVGNNIETRKIFRL